MLVGTLLSLSALAADARTVAVTYTARFDLPAAADQVCGATQICDCQVTWSGTGKLREASGDRLTFEGTWKVTAGACNEAFMLWTPTDGLAFHTVRLSGSTVTEWIAHDQAGDTTRFESDIKSRGQVWLAGMAAQIDPATHTASHFERESGMAGPFKIATEHSLTLTISP